MRKLVRSSEFGLVLVLLALAIALTIFGGSHQDQRTGQTVNNFLNSDTLLQIATESSFFAIMAVGMTAVIISSGIDLSVGSIYALTGVMVGLFFKKFTGLDGPVALAAGWGLGLAIGTLAGSLNGFLIANLGVHPFIISLGAMWVLRGIAFVTSSATSILFPGPLRAFSQASLGLRSDLHPVPLLLMLGMGVVGSLLLQKSVFGRRVFAIGGNMTAATYAGVPIKKTQIGIYAFSGVCAAAAALLGSSYYGSANCNDANGYELYVIASAVVGGVSLVGGKGSVWGAILGALLIGMLRQAIRTLHLDTNYEWIIIGTAIIVAVVLDRVSRDFAQKLQKTTKL